MNNRNALAYVSWVFAAAVALEPNFGLADQCPTPMSKIDPQVSVKVTFDKKSGNYRYIYSIKNENGAKLPIDHFAVVLAEKPTSLESPKYWSGQFVSASPSRATWISNPIESKDGSVIEPGDIRSGQTLSGFVITSSRPPGSLKYFAEGALEDVPRSSVKPGIDEPIPDCPGFDFDGSGGEFAEKILGVIEGPSNPTVISAKAKLRGNIAELLEHARESRQRLVEVMIFSSEDMDIGKIDVASVRFGLGNANAISSRFMSSELESDREDNDRPSFEKFKAGSKVLVLRFDANKIGVRCELDRALFLTGNAAGKRFEAGVSIKPLKCPVQNRIRVRH